MEPQRTSPFPFVCSVCKRPSTMLIGYRYRCRDCVEAAKEAKP